MKQYILAGALFFLTAGAVKAQWIYKGNEKERNVPLGSGQVFDRPFIGIDTIHFVQFAVYPIDIDPFSLGAPDVGQVWLILHRESFVKGQYGAFYIVKPFATADQARQSVSIFKKRGIECWYNSDLTGVTFEIIGTTTDGISDVEVSKKQ